MAYVDLETTEDVVAREVLLDRAFGPGRMLKTSERLREGRLAARGLSFVLREEGALIGTLRFWHISAGGVPALMLGPLAVDPTVQGGGHGKALMVHGITQAKALGHRAIILVGDALYYNRFGFERAMVENLVLPGPVDPARFLGLELAPGALQGASGIVRATGAIPLRSEEPATDRRRAA